MTKPNYILRAAVAACFGIAAGQAAAVVDLSVSPVTGITKFAKEIPATTTTLTNAGNILDLKVAVPTGYAVTAANPLYVKLNVTNGASFATSPTIGCGTAAAVSAAPGVLQLGGAGTAFAVFTIASSDTTMSGTCNATMGNLTISAGNLNTVAVSATVEYKNGLANAVTGVLSNYVTYVTGMVATVVSADSAVVVDATTGSILFTVTSNRSSTTLATLGAVKYTQVGTSAASAGGANNVSAGDVLGVGSASVTVNGPAIAAALAANGVSGIFLDAAASACTTKSYTISSTGASTVTFTGVSLANISAGVSVCISVAGGNTQITTGQMTASVGGTALANVTADFSTASNALETLSSNGTTKNAYFLNSSSSTTKTSVVRIVNNGGNAGPLTANAYNEAGTLIGTPNASLGNLAVNQMKSLSSAEIETALGLTGASAPAPTAKYRIVISGGLASYKVLNYTKDVVGGSIGLSQAQDD